MDSEKGLSSLTIMTQLSLSYLAPLAVSPGISFHRIADSRPFSLSLDSILWLHKSPTYTSLAWGGRRYTRAVSLPSL